MDLHISHITVGTLATICSVIISAHAIIPVGPSLVVSISEEPQGIEDHQQCGAFVQQYGGTDL